MKKLLTLAAIWLSVVVGMVAVARAATTCARTDMYCYESGPTGNLSTIGRLDAAGNETLAGSVAAGTTLASGTSATVGTKQMFTSANLRIGGVGNAITPTSTFMNLVSSGAVAYGAGVLNIATATATDGQYLILIATSTANAITLSTGSLTGVAGVDTSIVITTNPTSFIFNALTSLWYEIGKL